MSTKYYLQIVINLKVILYFRVEFYLKKSLEQLQLDYVDLYLIHFPIYLKHKESEPVSANPFAVDPAPTDLVGTWKVKYKNIRN